MKILVTGGAGFIGSNFILYMMNRYRDLEVVCVDALTYAADMNNLSAVSDDRRFSFYKSDIAEKMRIFKVFDRERPDIAVNFAAESHVDRSIENPDVFLKTNIIGTANLMDACLKFGTRRFHQISTDEVYGDLPLESGSPFRETDSVNPSSPYSASKASADMLVKSYVRTFGLQATITRCSNNYGIHQYREKLIPSVVEKAMRGDKIPLYGDGKNVRDWISVSDHCKAVDAVINHGRAGEIYNVGAGNEISNNALVRKILSVMGKSDSLIEYVADRAGHDRRYALNSDKIKRELGWIPETDFETEICKTVRYYMNKQPQ